MVKQITIKNKLKTKPIITNKENKKKIFSYSNIFKYKTANIILRKNHSNFFITLTDSKFKIISCKSAAVVLGKKERRRRRHAPQTIVNMINSLEIYFKRFTIK